MKYIEEILASYYNLFWLILSGFTWIITISMGIALVVSYVKERKGNFFHS